MHAFEFFEVPEPGIRVTWPHFELGANRFTLGPATRRSIQQDPEVRRLLEEQGLQSVPAGSLWELTDVSSVRRQVWQAVLNEDGTEDKAAGTWGGGVEEGRQDNNMAAVVFRTFTTGWISFVKHNAATTMTVCPLKQHTCTARCAERVICIRPGGEVRVEREAGPYPGAPTVLIVMWDGAHLTSRAETEPPVPAVVTLEDRRRARTLGALAAKMKVPVAKIAAVEEEAAV